MSEEGQTGFIESCLASFTEGMLSALRLQRPREKKYSRQIGTTLENVDKSAVISPTFGVIDKQLARLEVLLYIQNVISSYLCYTENNLHHRGRQPIQQHLNTYHSTVIGPRIDAVEH